MYDRALNQSRTSLTTNSSRASRIVRKRDSTFTGLTGRSKSKNKQDQCNTSFQEYLNRQSKLLNIQNVQAVEFQNSSIKGQSSATQKYQRTSGSNPLTLSGTLSAINLARNTIIQRSDRYIQPRASVIQKNIGTQHKQQRKRQPTPVKSKKQMASSSPSNKDLKKYTDQIFELQLRISGLQDALNLQKRAKQKNQNSLKQSQKDVINLKQILGRIQMQKKIIQNQNKNMEAKIDTLQKAVLQSENNLTLAQNNLNKLKQTIKQNRLAELQYQMKKVQKINDALKQSNQSNLKVISSLQDKIKTLSKQLQQMKKYGNLQMLASKQSMKQQYLQKQLQKLRIQNLNLKSIVKTDKQGFLQQRIKDQQKQIFQLKKQISRLLLKIHVLQSNKSKQITQVKQKCDTDIKTLRVKYSKMVVQLKTKKKPEPSTTSNQKQVKNTSPGSESSSKKSTYDIPCKCASVNNSNNDKIGTTGTNSITNNITNNYIYGYANSYVTNNSVNNGINNNVGYQNSYGSSQKPNIYGSNISCNSEYRTNSFTTRICQSSYGNNNSRTDFNFQLQLSPD